ncbi:ABC transporter substrate-binding protein [Caballeronia sp. DA-9]|uniref:ABC transporter substrate-binding protein n=1 Tax=Caballeronia sp. DA-9 TaxID=3436237 RepID=UPI003F67FE24
MKNLSLDRRKFIVSVGAAGISVVIPGASALAQDKPRKGGHLVVGLVGGQTTDSLDPALSNAQVMIHVLKQTSEQLIVVTPNGKELQPMLAEGWTHSDDLKTWNFQLRSNVAFHNGKRMTARDVVYSLNRHRGPKSKSVIASTLTSVQDIHAVSEHEIAVFLSEPNIDFPFLLTDYHLAIQPDGDPGDSGIGTGPYQIVEAKAGVRFLTKKFPNYWRRDVGHVDSIETLTINDNSARVSALMNGQVHLINRVEPKVVAMMSSSNVSRIVPTTGRNHYLFAMRCNVTPFDNPLVRQALKLAIDRDQMAKQIFRGLATVGNDTPINSLYPLATPLPQRKFDPTQAAALYKKSGHSGPIVLHTSDGAFPGAVDAAVLFKEQAAQAGIVIEVKREPGDGYFANIWNKVPFCASVWDGRPTQDQMLTTGYESSAPWNETAWSNPHFDDLIAQGRRERDAEKRVAIYREASELIRDNGGAIIPVFPQFLDGVSNKVGGYFADVNGELSNYRYSERCWLNT